MSAPEISPPAPIGGGTPIGGSGSSPYVAKWSGTSTLTTGILVDTGSSVGILQTSPVTTFQVGGNTVATPSPVGAFCTLGSNSRFTADDGTRAVTLAANGTDAIVGTTTAHDLVLQRGGVEAARIIAGGLLGVGTTSPSAPLHVFGPVADWTAKIQGSTTSGSSYGLLIRAGTTSADTALSVQGPTGTPSLLFVRGDGNVGIGTASPSSLGANYTTLDIRGSSGGGFKFGNATQHAYMYSDSSGFALSTQTNLPLNLYTNNGQLRASVGSTSLDISSTSNYGLKLPATPGNVDTQTLDCYAEGTWTPTLSAAATWGGTQPTVGTARYVRIGSTVYCTVVLIGAPNFSSTYLSTTITAPFSASYSAAVPISSGATALGCAQLNSGATTIFMPTFGAVGAATLSWTFIA